MPTLKDLSSDLVIYAARLVRALRRGIDYPAGVRVLSLLDEYGDSTVTALAELDRCSQPTMSGTVRLLAEQGWVAKRPDPADARANLISLTEPGRAELSRIRAANAVTMAGRAAERGLTADDLEHALWVLRTLMSSEADPDDPPRTEPRTSGENAS